MKNFHSLVKNIENVHFSSQKHAANAVNKALTTRNWLIGYYIIEFEQNGSDKAIYGEKLLISLANKFSSTRGLNERTFRSFRLFYSKYPQIAKYLNNTNIRKEIATKTGLNPIRRSLTTELENKKFTESKPNRNYLDGKQIISKLSYTHIEQLIRIDDQLKRTFYEIECIKNTWSVRELKRQISSLFFERTGLSENPEKLANLTNKNITPQTPADIIKNIYAFEFLDLNIKGVVEESDLETSLLNHLHNFIVELGNGFCFEARQKRILIGEAYYYIDLVFYHRILKCHVIVELKIGAFEHGDIGQLNTYLSYFKENIIEPNDNPPVGILLVADKDHTLVKYATASMDNNLFVQQYLVKLPSKEELEKYVNQELKKFA